MSSYKEILLESLISEGWELIEVDDHNHDWWCDEHWLIRSVRENWGIEVMIFFLVDPEWDFPRKKGQGIWAIGATDKFPEGWAKLTELQFFHYRNADSTKNSKGSCYR